MFGSIAFTSELSEALLFVSTRLPKHLKFDAFFKPIGCSEPAPPQQMEEENEQTE
jgi:hypothetical protein